MEWALDSTFLDPWNSTVSLLSGGAPFHKVRTSTPQINVATHSYRALVEKSIERAKLIPAVLHLCKKFGVF